ncbi:MAG: hypothetical protein IPJ68_00005 [Candidatus Moraniibacteriota bacterium]|nr:MAG: hypothetical protein IPJ68_00005 [Candidatus Moranbacteria bacterium]
MPMMILNWSAILSAQSNITSSTSTGASTVSLTRGSARPSMLGSRVLTGVRDDFFSDGTIAPVQNDAVKKNEMYEIRFSLNEIKEEGGSFIEGEKFRGHPPGKS